MTILFIRTIIIYALVVFALRLMGKRQIGELQPSELVVAIMISDLATMPMSDVSVPLVYGIVPIFTLVICEIGISFLCLKSETVRVIFNGKPQILVKDGRLQPGEMLHARVNTDDLLEELRKVGYFSLKDVDTVILETGGNITVIPSASARTPSAEELNLPSMQPKLSYIYIADGKVRHSELKRSGKDEKWLNKVLKKRGVKTPEEVFILTEDGAENMYFQKKEDR